MRVFNIFGILFYATVLILIGVAMIVFSFKALMPQDVYNLLAYILQNSSSRLIVGLSGLLLILISFSFAQMILGTYQREKTIAFKTPSGEVRVALSAVEDLIKRQAVFVPEVREMRPDVIATKKGIIVDLRVVLRSEANIPDLTSRLQDITRSKIQEVLGVEEQIIIKIHIAKIISEEERSRRKREPERQDPTIPFGGYRV